MSSKSPINLIETDWAAHQHELISVRRAVFIEEQGVPESLEIDQWDESSIHLLAFKDDVPLGCARLLPDGHFGRFAILRPYRQSGIGRRLFDCLEQTAIRMGFNQLKAAAQCDALDFYLKAGFEANAPFFDDAGIPHIDIQKNLNTTAGQQNTTMQLGRDRYQYQFDTPLEITGFVQAMLSQSPSQLDILVADIHEPGWNSQQLINSLSRYLTQSHRHRLRLLINQDKGISERPLMQLMARISSRCEILVNEQINRNNWIFYQKRTPVGLLAQLNTLEKNPQGKSKTNQTSQFKGQPFALQAASRASREFEQLWAKAAPSVELRKVIL
ncbi:MAG: GNAT family N-acetyltransferase [Oceanobacter sp.]